MILGPWLSSVTCTTTPNDSSVHTLHSGLIVTPVSGLGVHGKLYILTMRAPSTALFRVWENSDISTQRNSFVTVMRWSSSAGLRLTRRRRLRRMEGTPHSWRSEV